MSIRNPGQLILTCILLFFGLGSITIDGNATHLFNPAWSPHARYHLVMQAVTPNIMAGTLALLCLPWAYRSARRTLDAHVNNRIQTSHQESSTPMPLQEDAA